MIKNAIILFFVPFTFLTHFYVKAANQNFKIIEQFYPPNSQETKALLDSEPNMKRAGRHKPPLK